MSKSERNTCTIGISCIGSGVGESVINSCRLSSLPLKTIGLGTNPFAYGAYACDVMDYTPSIYDPTFIEDLIKKCLKHKIEFLIPGRDDEAHIYAKNRSKFEANGIKILAASEELISLCRDKERMSLELNPVLDVFVKCYQIDQLNEAIDSGEATFPLIAKPRSGFASKGVEIIRSKEDFYLISKDHIIQELAIPETTDPNYDFYIQEIAKNRNPQVSEISIQIVIGVNGELLGKMATFNKLNNGVPIEILPFDNEIVWDVVDKLIPEFLKRGLVGPLNIQGRLTSKGLKIFEMNPRFTGITGTRALMGFNEVEACIKSWLNIGQQPPLISFSSNRFGIRQTADRVMGLHKNYLVETTFDQINQNRFSKNKVVMITGASGYLGQCLVKELLDEGDLEIIAVGRDKNKLSQLFKDCPINCLDYSAIERGDINLGTLDIAIHAAFARPYLGNQAIAESLDLTQKLFTKLASHHVPFIVNISSQSVYGNDSLDPWDEDSPVAPNSTYGQAKYATELFLQSLQVIYPQIKSTSLRLGTLGGGQHGLEPVDFLSKMVLSSLKGENLNMLNGVLPVERLDVRDAAIGIVQLIKMNPSNISSIYNLSQGEIYSLQEVVGQIIKRSPIAVEMLDENKEFTPRATINNKKFVREIGWKPQYTLEETIDSLFSYFQQEKNPNHA